jgi:hypothetical protein
MDPRGYVGHKKAGGKYGVSNPRKKFTAPTFIEKPKQRSFVPLRQEEQSSSTKPYRISSVSKPTRGNANQYNYGLKGLGYTKMKEHDKYDYDIEEFKGTSMLPNSYMPSKKQSYFTNSGYQYSDSPREEEGYDDQIRLLTKKVELLEQKLNFKDDEIK